MFRAVTTLLLFGVLSPVATPLLSPLPPVPLGVASLPPRLSLPLGSAFSASGAIVVDLQSGRELLALRPDKPRPIASLAKIMTAVLIAERRAIDEVVTVPPGVLQIDGSAEELLPGERYTVEALLGALLVGSSNDAAYSLALHHSGSLESFAEEMNGRARALGLRQTRFENPMGFDSAQQQSTPRELAWLAMYAWKQDILRELAGRREYLLREQMGRRSITFHSTNHLLTSHPSSFFGLKTGTTALAGECLISLAQVAGRPVIFVILRSADRYRDTLTLLHLLSGQHA